MNLEQKIEAILFYRGEPVEVGELQKILKLQKDEINSALTALEGSLSARGVRLMRTEESVMLATAPEASALIEQITKEELSRDIGKAGIETLATILYLGPLTRSRIDYVRGVNSSFIVRNLMIRGLVERVTDQSDARAFLYRPTMDLLAHLGVTRVEELPDYATVRAELEEFEKRGETGGGEKGEEQKSQVPSV